MSEQKQPQYLNPYLAGVLLGLVLLASFLIAGRGIGASGFMSQLIVHSYDTANVNNDYLSLQKQSESFWRSWIIIEVIGVFIGAWLSAKFAGRIKVETIKANKMSNKQRLVFALLGGMMMGFAARIARGCTSGQALSGGALLNIGSWTFMLCVFLGGYLAIIWLRKYW